MKIVTETTTNEGIESLLGKNVTLFCMNYIYTGTLVGVDDVQVKLDNAKIVYETGSLDSKDWSDAQSLPNGTWYVCLSSVESYGILKQLISGMCEKSFVYITHTA